MRGWLQRLGLSETARVMCAAVGALFVGLLAVGLVVSLLIYPFERPLAFSLGLLLGCALSVAKIVLMERSFGRLVEMDGARAKNFGALHALARYALTIAALLLVVFFPGIFGLVGTIAGVLSLQIAAYITSAVLKKRERAL